MTFSFKFISVFTIFQLEPSVNENENIIVLLNKKENDEKSK
jgi:hypothetical protein